MRWRPERRSPYKSGSKKSVPKDLRLRAEIPGSGALSDSSEDSDETNESVEAAIDRFQSYKIQVVLLCVYLLRSCLQSQRKKELAQPTQACFTLCCANFCYRITTSLIAYMKHQDLYNYLKHHFIRQSS